MDYTLKNEYLTIKISDDGAQLLSLVRNDNKKEYLWNGNPKYWNRSAPILFPIVGALKDKKYKYNGKIYTMSNHGFARDSKFELNKKMDNKLSFLLTSNENTKKIYPFDFTLEYSYELRNNQVIVECNVANKSDDKMYFSIGAHPAFLCDFSKEKFYFKFDKKDNFKYKLISDEGLLIDKAYIMELDNDKLLIQSHMFDKDALIIENDQIHEVSLLDEKLNEYVKVKFDTHLLGLWSPAKKNAPFVCIEPWCGRCDRVDSDGEFTKKDYINVLEKDGVFKSSYSIEIK